MTVEELIKLLSVYDPGLEVVIDAEGACSSIEEVTLDSSNMRVMLSDCMSKL